MYYLPYILLDLSFPSIYCPPAKSLSRVWLFVTPLTVSLSGSSIHGIFQARIMEWVAIFLLQGIFLTQGWNLCLLYCRWILYPPSYWGKPFYILWKWIYSVLLRFFTSLVPMEIGNIFVWLWYQGETGLTEWVGEILPNI